MSFLLRTPLVRTAPRAFSSSPTTPLRAFSISAPHLKVTDPAKDALKTADRSVSDTIVSGIEKGEELTQKAKEATGLNASKVKGQAEELKGEAKGKAKEYEGEAQGLKEQAKGKASEYSGKAEGAKEEAKGKLGV